MQARVDDARREAQRQQHDLDQCKRAEAATQEKNLRDRQGEVQNKEDEQKQSLDNHLENARQEAAQLQADLENDAPRPGSHNRFSLF